MIVECLAEAAPLQAVERAERHLLREVFGQTLLESNHLPDAAAGNLLDLAGIEDLEREPAPQGLTLQHVADRRGDVIRIRENILGKPTVSGVAAEFRRAPH